MAFRSRVWLDCQRRSHQEHARCWIGLLHVSAFPRDKQSSFMRDYKPGDEIKVQVTNYDKETGRIRLGLKK